jgi:hypothetical protein
VREPPTGRGSGARTQTRPGPQPTQRDQCIEKEEHRPSLVRERSENIASRPPRLHRLLGHLSGDSFLDAFERGGEGFSASLGSSCVSPSDRFHTLGFRIVDRFAVGTVLLTERVVLRSESESFRASPGRDGNHDASDRTRRVRSHSLETENAVGGMRTAQVCLRLARHVLGRCGDASDAGRKGLIRC